MMIAWLVCGTVTHAALKFLLMDDAHPSELAGASSSSLRFFSPRGEKQNARCVAWVEHRSTMYKPHWGRAQGNTDWRWGALTGLRQHATRSFNKNWPGYPCKGAPMAPLDGTAIGMVEHDVRCPSLVDG